MKNFRKPFVKVGNQKVFKFAITNKTNEDIKIKDFKLNKT